MWWKVVRAQTFFVWCMQEGVERGQSIEPSFCIKTADIPQRGSFASGYLQLVLLFDVVFGTQKSARRLRTGQSIMSMKLAITDFLPLPNSSNKIPKLGFGVYQSSPSQCVQSCFNALKAGYRHIDTAQFYANEAEVGKAVQDSGIKRSDVFLTTKILSASGSVQKSYEKCLASVERIDPGKDGYVDLFLIHSPNSGKEKRKEMWLAVERLYDEGKVKSIGVSNYGVGHIEEMKAYAKVWPPQVNQIEVCRTVPHLYGIGTAYTTFPQLHPWCQQKTIVQYCQKHGIIIEAYCPLVRNYKANDPTLVEMSKKYGKTTAQVLVRYCLQKNWVPLPKSDNPERIAQNADVYGFELAKVDMSELDNLDQGPSGAIVEAVVND